MLAQFGAARHADAKQTSDTLISIFSVANSPAALEPMGSDALALPSTGQRLALATYGAAHAMLIGARYLGLVYLATVCAAWPMAPSGRLCPRSLARSGV